jgi:hypothetical protein
MFDLRFFHETSTASEAQAIGRLVRLSVCSHNWLVCPLGGHVEVAPEQLCAVDHCPALRIKVLRSLCKAQGEVRGWAHTRSMVPPFADWFCHSGKPSWFVVKPVACTYVQGRSGAHTSLGACVPGIEGLVGYWNSGHTLLLDRISLPGHVACCQSSKPHAPSVGSATVRHFTPYCKTSLPPFANTICQFC